MKKIIFGLVLSFVVSGFANAQTVATIAVADINVSSKSNSEQDLVGAFSQDLLTALKETRKFSVLTNDELVAKLAKQDLNVQGYYDKTYTGAAYDQVGLDYILTADITQFDVSTQASGSNGLGAMQVKVTMHGVADTTEDFSLSSSVNLTSLDSTAKTSSTSKQLVALGANDLTEQVLIELFPIRVMKLDEDQGVVSLNYGAGLLSVGDIIKVYPFKEDELLNEPGSPQGTPVATLRITNTDTKFATAQAIDGFSVLEKGQRGLLQEKKDS